MLCATHNDLGLIRTLKKLGYFIIATGGIKDLVGEKFCDKFILADYSDKEKILQIAQKEQVCAVLGNCNDFGTISAAYVAQSLNLRGYDDYETTLTICHKDKFKQFCLKNDIQSPVSMGFCDINEALNFAQSANFPLIVKPVDLMGGRGVGVGRDFAEFRPLLEKAFEISRQKRIVIEPFIKGIQGGFCAFLLRQKVAAFATNNEFSILNPYRVEIDTFPAKNHAQIAAQLVPQIEKIAKILRLKDGIFHVQFIWDGQKAWIIEAMRRILGNMYHIPANLLTNIDWEYWQSRANLALSLANFPKNVVQEGFFAYKTILADKNGVLKSIKIPPKYEKFIISKFKLREKGFKITSFSEQPLGFLFMQFSSSDEMHENLVENYEILAEIESEKA